MADANLLLHTPPTPHAKPTYYWLTWPPMWPHDATQAEKQMYAELRARYGPHPSHIDRWIQLAGRISDHQAQLAKRILQYRQHSPDLDPWLLEVLAAWPTKACQSLSNAIRQTPSAQQSLL